MRKTIFVISDLHLGGEPARGQNPGFQMCSPNGQARLKEFLDWVSEQKSTDCDIQLVVAGDIVDFLAEKDRSGQFSAFTSDQELADSKLKNIIENTHTVWEGFAGLVAGGCALTLMLGNHDIELSLPKVRQRLLETLGPGRVDFIYDNEAFNYGGLLIEHGNRYEGFNVVSHDSLRRIRSLLSRNVNASQLPSFPAQPGSEFVVRVMNRIKGQFAFVDLLKPETAAVLPIIAVLDPAIWLSAGPAIYSFARAAWRQSQYDSEGQPTNPDFVAAPILPAGKHSALSANDDLALARGSTSSGEFSYDADYPEAPHFAQADELAHASNALESDKIAAGAPGLIPRTKLALLYKALRHWAANDTRTFDVERESQAYLRPAANLAQRGFKVDLKS